LGVDEVIDAPAIAGASRANSVNVTGTPGQCEGRATNVGPGDPIELQQGKVDSDE